MIGVVDEDVALTDRAPHVGRLVEGRHRLGDEGSVLQAREVDGGVELGEVGEGREAFSGVEVLRVQLQLVDEPGEDVGGQVGVVLEADRVTHPALAQALLDAGEEVVVLSPVELEVRIARHADSVRGEDLVAVVEPREMEADDVLQEHEGVLAGRGGQADEAGEDLGRDVHDGERRGRQGRGLAHSEAGDQTEGAVHQMGERVPGIDGERRHHGEDRAVEVLGQHGRLLGGDVLRADEPHPLGGEEWLDVLEEAAVLLVHELVDAERGGGAHLRRRSRVRRAFRLARDLGLSELALQVGHADHEELVEVRTEDGEELHPLEEGHGRVLGLLEDPSIEFQPGELAVDQDVRPTGRHGSRLTRRRFPGRAARRGPRRSRPRAGGSRRRSSALRSR